MQYGETKLESNSKKQYKNQSFQQDFKILSKHCSALHGSTLNTGVPHCFPLFSHNWVKHHLFDNFFQKLHVNLSPNLVKLDQLFFGFGLFWFQIQSPDVTPSLLLCPTYPAGFYFAFCYNYLLVSLLVSESSIWHLFSAYGLHLPDTSPKIKLKLTVLTTDFQWSFKF